MKLVLASAEGEAHFGLIDGLLPDLDVVRARTPEETLAAVADADVLYGMPSAAVVAAAPHLRWIQSSAAGVEFIAKVPTIVEGDVVVTNTRGAHGPSIAEHVFGLLLAMTRELPACLDQQRRRYWSRQTLYRTAREIRGLTMGLVGFGAISRAIAHRATAFDLTLAAVDAQAVDGQPYLDEVWPSSRLPELLATSDVVVVAAPLTTETRGMIGADEIAAMKASGYLIVVSRGGIVDEAALAAALGRGHLAGAALDVTEVEPLPEDSPLWDAPRLILTPHLAGASDEKERRCVEILRDNLLRFAAGEPLLNVVDKKLGY